MNKLVIAAVGALAFAGAAQAQELLYDSVVVGQASGEQGNGILDGLGLGKGTITFGTGTFTLSQASTVVIDAVTSTNSGITGNVWITQASNTLAPIFDAGIGGGQIDSNSVSLAAGQYTIEYNLGNSNVIEPLPQNDAENLVGIQVDAVSAPEIDPASAASGLTLLAGALLVLRGRRRTTSAVSFA
jgi:hypothetical protein